MIKRFLYTKLKKHLEQQEIAILVGPRQAGKTTLLKQLAEESKSKGKPVLFLNLDIDIDAQFFTSQQILVDKINLTFGDEVGVIFIDEIQRKTNAGLFLKGLFDRKLPHKFVVSGSGSIHLKEEIYESLTGRKKMFFLNTVSFKEFVDYKTDYKYSNNLSKYLSTDQIASQQLLEEYLTYGGYPRVITSNTAQEKREVLQEIYQSYLIKDISFLMGIKKTDLFTNLVKFLADQIGHISIFSKFTSVLNTSFVTIQNYLWYLENTFIIKKVIPFHKNKLKEIKKAPSFYFQDLGLRNSVLNSFDMFKSGTERGFLFQNFILRIIQDELDNLVLNYELKFWRTKHGAEIDLILDLGKKIIPIEIKYKKLQKKTITFGMTRFIADYKPKKILVINTHLNEIVKQGKTEIHFLPFYQVFNLGKIISL